MSEKPITVAEAGELLGFSPTQIRLLYRKGLIRGFRVGGRGHIRLYRDSVVEFRQSCENAVARLDVAEATLAARADKRGRRRPDVTKFQILKFRSR